MRFTTTLLCLIIVFVILPFSSRAQPAAEVTITLNEAFLNEFLDAVFANLETPTFQLNGKKTQTAKTQETTRASGNPKCEESITLLREANGVRTAVKFENGKLVAPLAFSGTYDIPFIGCSNFRGWARSELELQYDAGQRALLGRAKVTKVDLNGIPGVASSVVARLVQGTIDRRLNPIEILRAEQVAATIPVKYANGALRLRAVDMQPEVTEGALNVRIAFEFAKAN